MGDPMPWVVEPMTATAGDLPDETSAWALELKWDGVRAITYLDGKGGVRATGRRGTEIGARYPELSGLADLLPHHGAVLDGEVVAFEQGRPSFERLQRRMHVSDPHPRLVRDVPVHYVVFDLLFLDGHSLLTLPYVERRSVLDDLELTGGPIESPSYLPGSDTEQVVELLEYTKEEMLEGLMAKRLDSPYLPGRRVDTWRKIKNYRTQEVVIGGWKPGQGRRAGGIGSLLLGVYFDGLLFFVGHVGTGFTDQALDEMAELLEPLARPTSPFDDEVPREYAKDAHWVSPELVGEVAYGEWTSEGRLRMPSWRGLRADKDPREAQR
jgi:DNA ligase D-like protein (predicted ligase)